ncbi:hypothetical protein ElP_48850 [Tautonia plasticadhaerens]|uniref:Uncharacterized protein n=1 Tax=Tautonia plasticadhaerens TaxID=2527974 RepID=A0A518H7Z2_9BACT|nr:hypothetical protein ElP_48850 [Tautonia plasticadhaerens]
MVSNEVPRVNGVIPGVFYRIEQGFDAFALYYRRSSSQIADRGLVATQPIFDDSFVHLPNVFEDRRSLME